MTCGKHSCSLAQVGDLRVKPATVFPSWYLVTYAAPGSVLRKGILGRGIGIC